MTDAISLKDFRIACWLGSPHPNLRIAVAAHMLSNYKVTEMHTARVQMDWQHIIGCVFGGRSLPQSRSLVQGYCCEVAWQRLFLLTQDPGLPRRCLGSVKTHGNGTLSALAIHVTCRRTKGKGNIIFSQLPKELARSQRKLQLVGVYSEQLLQLVCKPYENNIRPVITNS